MGYYIQTDSNLNKAQFLVQNFAAEVQTSPHYTDGDFVTVCVVNNRGLFEAAGVCYRPSEFEAFNQPDDYRPKTWLTMKRAEAIRAEPSLKEVLT